MTAANWYRDLFRIDSSQISALLFVRIAIAVGAPLLGFALATVAAAFGRLGFAPNPAPGYLAFTVFVILIVELVRVSSVPPFELVLTRLYDVGVGCVIALAATLIAGVGRRYD